MSDSPFIIDVTRENYAQLMEASFQVPVLLDFWAGWCQPCQVLMPILAGLAEEYDGKFLLGKLNTEEEQEIAMQFGIRSIPTVKLFRNGEPVDEFMGALPEGAVREFLDRHVAPASGANVQQAREHLASGDLEAAKAALDSMPADERDRPEVTALLGQLYFAGEAATAPAAADLEARLASDPNDHEALHQLALHKVVEGDYDTAMTLLLELMQKDRRFGDDAGREGLLRIFELLGDDPRVRQYRGRMASLLH